MFILKNTTFLKNIFFSYHRILRKEKVKNEQKAIDELQKKDPEAYTDKVLRIEKDRVKVKKYFFQRYRYYMDRLTCFSADLNLPVL